MIRLVDGNNYFRRMLESDGSPTILRNLVGEVDRSDAVEIWVWDGPNHLKIRRNIYPAYKTNRTPTEDGVRELTGLFREALCHTKALQIQVPGFEADDVIATLAETYRPEGIKIISNDKDFLQISGVLIDRDPIAGIAASDIRLYKTLVGDKSDNIPGLAGFGEKAWTTCDRDAFRDFFETRTGVPQDLAKVQEQFGITPKPAKFLMENTKDVLAMWDIIGFFHVPPNLIAEHTASGKPDAERADAVLSEYLH